MENICKTMEDSYRIKRLKQVIDNCNYTNQIKCQYCRHNKHCKEFIIYSKLKEKENEANNIQ